MSIQRPKFDINTPKVVGIPFLCYGVKYKTGESFDYRKAGVTMRQLRGLYLTRRINDRQENEQTKDKPIAKKARKTRTKKES